MWTPLSDIRPFNKSDMHEGLHAGVTLMHDEVDVPDATTAVASGPGRQLIEYATVQPARLRR